MSGITPLLDTLLHQVLGRRVDIPVARDLNQPVAPALPVDGARATHSDSRLDARLQGQAPLAAQVQGGESARGAISVADPAARQASAPSVPSAPGSTVITLSAAAQDIADLLQRYPSPQAAIRPAAPLFLSVPPGVSPPPEQIAAQLRGSIEHSGLFFESHVTRWVRGELPIELLQREPQMQAAGSRHGAERAALVTPAPSPLIGGSGSVPVSVTTPLGEPEAGAALRLPEGAPVQEPEGGEMESVAVEDAAEPARPDSLAVMVRHQLELLAVPQLRWEGQVWAGLFMAMTIDAPSDWEEAAAGEGDDAGAGSRERGGEWRVRLDLQLAGAGGLQADICLQGESVDLALRSDASVVREYLRQGHELFRQRLMGCGFARVEIQIGGGVE